MTAPSFQAFYFFLLLLQFLALRSAVGFIVALQLVEVLDKPVDHYCVSLTHCAFFVEELVHGFDNSLLRVLVALLILHVAGLVAGI